MKVAVVGSTGLVGSEMLKVLTERKFPVTELIPVASERSAGKKVTFLGKEYTVVTPQTAIEMKPDLALFSAGGGTSLEWAPKFADAGITVVDNSSAWRMDPTKKLVVPEINADARHEQLRHHRRRDHLGLLALHARHADRAGEARDRFGCEPQGLEAVDETRALRL